MRAIANSSVLIALSTIHREGLLIQRFPEGILVPRSVWHEVVEQGSGQKGADRISAAPWITVLDVKDTELVSFLRLYIDQGEAEAIALFREEKAEVLLLDEKDARRVARHNGIPVLGTVGILIWAKRNGLIDSLSAELDALQEQGNFRLSQQVCQEALRTVGEV
ncbi:MAG: DUF3368 domain-containing protein [bacterium]